MKQVHCAPDKPPYEFTSIFIGTSFDIPQSYWYHVVSAGEATIIRIRKGGVSYG
jgi:hypothetical protein